jgi:hypothetical protein
MPHTIRNAFDKHLTIESLLDAHERASKTKRYSKEVLKFDIDLESNIVNLYKKLKNGTYRMGKYRTFKIYEPKERVIRALPYVDRIVHQWYIYEFIKPYVVPRFINDSYACIEGKGTHKAVNRAQEYMQKMFFWKYLNMLVKCFIWNLIIKVVIILIRWDLIFVDLEYLKVIDY